MSKIDSEFQNNHNNFNSDTMNHEANMQKEKQKNCCKRVTRFIFSHIGLVIMVVLYSVAGAFLFLLLEQHQEAKNCQEGKGLESASLINLKSRLLTYIQFNITSNPNDLSKDNETTANLNIESWLEGFRSDVLGNQANYKYTGDCSKPKWNFANSLLFAVTIITTIGYGQISPITWEGQIVCICYATIGIPLFLMCIANISGLLGDMFRFMYARVCCRLCLKKKKPNQSKTEAAQDGAEAAVPEGASAMEKQLEAKDYNGDSQWNQNLANVNPKSVNNGAKVIDDNEDLENELKDEEEEDKVSVPLTITMIIITVYIFIGAYLFNQFEGWTLIQAAYFCFITLSTIGFGDFVPGQNFDDPMQGPKLVLAAVYVLFGMAILAMCFDLMQEEIIAKFTWVGKKLGIVDKEDEEEEDSNENAEKDAKKETKEEQHKNDNNSTKNNDMYGSKNFKGSKPSFVDEKSGGGYNGGISPAPSYPSSAVVDDQQLLRQFRTAYLQNVVQRQQFKS